MDKKLEIYLRQTNDSLLRLFKQDSQGELRFYEFMALVRDEKVPEGVISMTIDEAVKIKDDIIEEFGE